MTLLSLIRDWLLERRIASLQSNVEWTYKHGSCWCNDYDVYGRDRIRTAFSILLANSSQWPSPSKFIDALPAITERPALPAKTFTDTERLANLDRLAGLAKEIGW